MNNFFKIILVVMVLVIVASAIIRDIKTKAFMEEMLTLQERQTEALKDINAYLNPQE